MTVAKGASAAAYSYASTLLRALFKEFQVADPLFQAGKAAALGHDSEIVLKTFQEHWDRVGNASARFSLMDSDVPY